MRVLITGGAGFIGRHVIEALQRRGHGVVALVRRPQSLPCPTIQADLSVPAEVRAALEQAQPTTILHLAWYAVPGKFWTAAENLDAVAWTLSLAQAAVTTGCSRFVGAGSVAEYAWSHPVLKEQSPLQPATLYGWSKKATFELLNAWFHHRADFAWLRYGWTFGPGEPPGRLVSNLLAGLRAGEAVPCSEGTQRRDFLYVEDLADATAATTESALVGAINVGSGVSTPVHALISGVELLLGRSAARGARPAEPPPELVLDVRRLREELNWKPRFTLEEGLRRTVG